MKSYLLSLDNKFNFYIEYTCKEKDNKDESVDEKN